MRLTALLLAFVLAACETTVDLDLPEHHPVLVVNGLVGAGEPLTFEVSRSYSIDEPPWGNLPDATIELLEDGAPVGPLVRDTINLKRWIAPGRMAHEGRTYSLRVAAPGYADVDASTTVPAKPIASATAQPLEDRDPYPYPYGQTYEVTVRLTDTPGQADYYALSLDMTEYRGETEVVYGSMRSSSISSSDPVLRDGDQGELLDDETHYQIVGFSDRLFDGQTRDVRFRTLLVRPQPESTHLKVNRIRYFVVVRRISEALYRRLKAARHSGDAGPFGEPVQLPGNVHGGLGLFAGYHAQQFLLAELGPWTGKGTLP